MFHSAKRHFFSRLPALLLTALLVLLSVSSLLSIADSAPEVLSGDGLMIRCDVGDELLIGEKRIPSAKNADWNIRAVVSVSDASSSYNMFYLNGKEFAPVKDGINVLEIPVSKLQEENRLGIRLGHAKGTYTEENRYGSMNLDDIAVQSVRFEQAGFTRPSGMEKWMPIQNDAGKTVVRMDYADNHTIGDGWQESTGLGGTTPDTPVAIDYLFPKPDANGVFIVDTTTLPDGINEFVFISDGIRTESRTYIIDNTPPEITFSHESGAILCRADELTCEVKDTNGKSIHTLYVDGAKVPRVRLDKLSLGGHSFSVEAEDKSGNKCRRTMLFTLTDRAYGLTNENGNASLKLPDSAKAYDAKLQKTVRMYENPYGTWDRNHLRTDDEKLVSVDAYPATVSLSSDGSVPYQSFVVEVDDPNATEVVVSYTGITGSNVPILLRAWNQTEKRWDDIGKTPSGEPFAVSLETKTYVKDGKMRVSAFPDPVFNGSNTILWDSDTQYYTSFDDLFPYYLKINNYALDRYNKGTLAYVVHTGDLVDHTELGEEEAAREFKMAVEAQDILDKNNVPNGVVSGNHDIRHHDADYSYYLRYFPASRYEGFDWYGGQLNDNVHHFDLVSVGKYDFLFLYIGCYRETDEDFIDWANAVCKAYPDRNVVLCTHEYLVATGEYSGDRAQVIWEKIALPNENVKLILCGHNDGVCDRWHEVEGQGRKVLEILADYQFAENGQGPQHIINNCTCDGEGYVRLMTFTDRGQLVSTTYSPVAEDYGMDPYDFFPPYMDSFTYDLDLISADRSIRTTDFHAAVKGAEISVGSDRQLTADGKEAVFGILDDGKVTKLLVSPYSRSYEVPLQDEQPAENEPRDDVVTFSGRKNISPSLFYRQSDNLSSLSYVEKGLELMPDDAKKLRFSSGSSDYTAEVKDGKLHLSHRNAGAGWIVLACTPIPEVDFSEYSRLYFSVTTSDWAKWNLTFQIQGKDYSFSRMQELAGMFGYEYAIPSDISGSWSGYIDLSPYVTGKGRINSVLFTAATPGMDVTFDYLFLGKSNGGGIEFQMNDGSVKVESALGEQITPPAAPGIAGKTFLGWYDKAEGGKKVETLTAQKDFPSVYAVYEDKPAAVARAFQFFDEEVTIESSSGIPVWVWFVIGGVVLVAAIAVILLALKKKKPVSGGQ